MNDLLNPRFSEFLEKIAQSIADKENIFIIGKGSNYPMALESAIKIQEVSYIHAEGFAAGELKHGPIAMIEKGTPCLVLVSDNDRQRREILSNAMEIKARGGNIIGIAPDNSEILIIGYECHVPELQVLFLTSFPYRFFHIIWQLPVDLIPISQRIWQNR